ncbi:DUF4012 domain-containing protein [Nocardioides gilvus]|uniref:DUF4012 domain-containing protein n=1 Tax=Nocardioides gilvus TaxID=1735589 RepID=UPI0013A53FEC|nr:DUF4012 domain-containing protein [Nocardioides gilvus]
MSLLRRHWPLSALGALALLIVGLALLALPLRSVPADASAAQDELTLAVEALKANDTDQGFDHVANARYHVDEVTESTDGFGPKILSWVPLMGSGVRDVRDLATAMGHLTSAMEVAEELYPQISGDGSQLLSDGNVDLAVLDTSLRGLKSMTTHLRAARTHLHDVEGNNLMVGDTTANARDTALEKVDPAASTLDNLSPLFDSLPEMLGSDGRRGYVVAMMNPTEMKYSGGSMLTFSRLRINDGRIKQDEASDTSTDQELFRLLHWKRVEDNPFSVKRQQRITHANSAPSWPVSGEDTLRAWDKLQKQKNDGLIAVDLVAMASLLKATGPLEVEGLGTVTSENLVPLIAADYARFGKNEQDERKSLNQALIPAFMDRIFSGVDFITTMQALGESAKGRHMALYFRDEPAQEASTAMGFAGDLSDTEHDYIGAFTQNRVGSKADFWQQKELKHDVRLNEDGSARVTLRTTIINTGPTQLQGEFSAYTDPTLDLALTSFLPQGAEVRRIKLTTTAGGAPAYRKARDYYGRQFLTNYMVLDAQEEGVLKVTYEVPAAAVRQGDELTYRLDIDPHPTVKKEKVQVTVRWPDGFAPSRLHSLPEGWMATEKGHSRWKTAELEGITSLELTATSGR